MAAAYSMDVRERVIQDADSGLSSKDLATRYPVSRAWVDALKQRRGAAGSDTGRSAGRLGDHGEPDHDLARTGCLGAHPQKKRCTPTSSAGLTWPRPGGSGATARRSGRPIGMCAADDGTPAIVPATHPRSRDGLPLPRAWRQRTRLCGDVARHEEAGMRARMSF